MGGGGGGKWTIDTLSKKTLFCNGITVKGKILIRGKIP